MRRKYTFKNVEWNFRIKGNHFFKWTKHLIDLVLYMRRTWFLNGVKWVLVSTTNKIFYHQISNLGFELYQKLVIIWSDEKKTFVGNGHWLKLYLIYYKKKKKERWGLPWSPRPMDLRRNPQTSTWRRRSSFELVKDLPNLEAI